MSISSDAKEDIIQILGRERNYNHYKKAHYKNQIVRFLKIDNEFHSIP